MTVAAYRRRCQIRRYASVGMTIFARHTAHPRIPHRRYLCRVTRAAIRPVGRYYVYARLQAVGIAGNVAGQTESVVCELQVLTCVVLSV